MTSPASTGRAVPRLSVVAPDGPARGLVLVLPGGRVHGERPVGRCDPGLLRMRPFVSAIRRRVPGAAIVVVHYRHRGWNDPRADPLDDVASALRTTQPRYGRVPVVLVGHSMGGRAALRAAGLPRVEGVVGLAPWIPEGEPVEQLADRDLVLIHGSRDHTTSPAATARFAARAAPIAREVVSLRLVRTGHPMLRRASVWHRLTVESVGAILSGASISGIGGGEPGISRPTNPEVVRDATEGSAPRPGEH